MSNKPKLLIIGIDGATFDIIKPLAAAGELPALAGLMGRGAHCLLKSTIPPISPCAWTTFGSGVRPGKHGVLDFCYPVAGTYHLARSYATHSRSRSVWELLEQAGLSVGLYNMPWSNPVAARRGYVIGGFDMLGTAQHCNPPRLAHEIAAALGPDALASWSCWDDDGNLPPAALDVEVDRNTAVARYLLTHHPTEVFAAVYLLSDRVQHFLYAADVDFANGDDPRARLLLHTYKSLDNAVSQLLGLVPEDATVLVASDHGARPVRGSLNLDAILAHLGVLAYREGLPHWSEMLAPRPSLRRRLLDPIWHRIRDVVRRRLPRARARIRFTPRSRQFSAVDWSRTKAFSWGFSPLFRVNLRGREPRGVVEPADYDAFCDDLAAQLRAYRHPDTDEPVFELVEKAADLYQGPHAKAFADLVAMTKDCAYATNVRIPHPEAPVVLDEQVQIAYRRMAHHKPPLPIVSHHHPDGVCILAGPGIPAEEQMRGPASIADIAPTLLYLLGQPIPLEMDGQAMSGLLGSGSLAVRPPTYSDTPLSVAAQPQPLTYSTEEARQVEQRLRDLGYLE